MELWRNKYRMESFSFEDRKAVIVFPEKRDARGRWALKTQYFAAFQDLEEALVERGFHLLYLENRNRWGTNDDLDAKERFMRAMAEKYDLAPKGMLVGMSCGGLHAIKQAARHPDTVSLLYLDAPVVNLLSCPFGLGACGSDIESHVKQETLDALGLTMSGMIAYRDHPLDRLPALVESRIPALLVWGEADSTVPFEENGLHVQKAYEQAGLPLLCQSKPGTGHHPHGPADMESALTFILENA